MKGCKPFIFHRIDRLCRSGGAIFRSTAQKNHFRSLAMQDEHFHPAWRVSKTSFFDTLSHGLAAAVLFYSVVPVFMAFQISYFVVIRSSFSPMGRAKIRRKNPLERA